MEMVKPDGSECIILHLNDSQTLSDVANLPSFQ